MSHPFNQNNAGDNENLRAAVSQLQQERNRQMNQRGNMLSPQQQQMMGQGLLRPGANPNANLTSQLINMIQSPGSMGPNFNPYARPSGPQQNNRFQQFLPPFGGQPHHAGPFANPYGQNVGSPEERAARAQAQAQAAQFQNGPYGYGRQGQSQGLPNGSPNSQQFPNFEAAAAAARIQSQINMMKNSTGQGEAAARNDTEGDSGEKGKEKAIICNGHLQKIIANTVSQKLSIAWQMVIACLQMLAAEVQKQDQFLQDQRVRALVVVEVEGAVKDAVKGKLSCLLRKLVQTVLSFLFILLY